VSNGNGVAGCARLIADQLRMKGGVVLQVGDAGRADFHLTEVRYNPGDVARAELVRAALGFGTVKEANRPSHEVEVVVGEDAAARCAK
jgi:hypothetical protein